MPKEIEQYEHTDKTRPNNPPVGLVTPKTDPDAGKKVYAYDPHLDPALQWARKAARASFEVPTGTALLSAWAAPPRARAVGFGKWVQTRQVLTLYAADGVTVVHTFTLRDPAAPQVRD